MFYETKKENLKVIVYLKKTIVRNGLNTLDLPPSGSSLFIEDNDFALFDDIRKVPLFKYPAKTNVAVSVICLKGKLGININLKHYTFGENQVVSISPNQILQFHEATDDFSGRFIVMSQNFLKLLQENVEVRFPIYYKRENSSIQFSSQQIALCMDYYSMLDNALRMKDNPKKIENVKYLILALFYALNSIPQDYQRLDKKQSTRKDAIFESFYKLLQLHHKEYRNVGFYADKLCLTPKYFSTLIREATGKTACEWIDESVILLAKALLKSTDMTIQEISDHLSFTDQSFFGKYFKRRVGVSPMEYRKKK